MAAAATLRALWVVMTRKNQPLHELPADDRVGDRVILDAAVRGTQALLIDLVEHPDWANNTTILGRRT